MYQAAIGPIAMDMCAASENPCLGRMREEAVEVFTLAVLAILITAPIGSIAISIGGKKLLPRAVSLPLEELTKDNKEHLSSVEVIHPLL